MNEESESAPARGSSKRELDDSASALPRTRHDALFRHIVANPGRAGALLRDHLPKKIADWLDLDRLPERVDASAVDGDGRATAADAIYRVRLKADGERWAFALLEHKSYTDPGTPLQLLRYMARLWSTDMDRGSASGCRLPPIIPMVVYHGRVEWNSPLSMRDMTLDHDDPDLFGQTSEDLVFVNLMKIPSEELSLDPSVRAGMVALKLSWAKGRSVSRADAGHLVAGLAGTEYGTYLMSYLAQQVHVTRDDLRDASKRSSKSPEEYREREEVMTTIEETMLKEGRAQGMAKALFQQAKQKFGNVPKRREEQLRDASQEELERWLTALITAEDIDAVFDGPTRR